MPLLALFRARKHELRGRPPPAARPVAVVLPSNDEPEPIVATTLADMIGCTLAIEYIDAKGEASRRRVTVRGIAEAQNGTLLRCYCHERQAPRSFRLDRVQSAIDLASGEVFDSVTEWLASQGISTIARAEATDPLRAAEPGMIVLSFLAHCDGDYDPREHAVIRRYVEAAAPGHGLRSDYLERRVRALYPDEEMFEDACELVEAQGMAAFTQLAEYAADLVAADGEVTEDEAFWIKALHDELGQ